MNFRKNKNERYHLFDTVRGLCIAGMVLYHALFDCVYVFGLFAISDSILNKVVFVRDLGCVLFVLLAGMCEHFGKDKYKRAFGLLAIGVVISLFSFFFMPQQAVAFGVLSFMGVASFLLQPLRKMLLKAKPLPLFVVFFALFLLLFNAAYGTFGFYGLTFGRIPEMLYVNTLTAIFGFPPSGFSSSDYFPIIPWLFLYFAGFFLFSAVKNNAKFKRIASLNIRPLSFVGRYSLWFYLAHQPIIIAILWIIT